MCLNNGRYTIADFEDEVKHLIRLQPHKNIVKFIGFYKNNLEGQEKVWHIVTEYMLGGTLEMLCRETKVYLIKILLNYSHKRDPKMVVRILDLKNLKKRHRSFSFSMKM